MPKKVEYDLSFFKRTLRFRFMDFGILGKTLCSSLVILCCVYETGVKWSVDKSVFVQVFMCGALWDEVDLRVRCMSNSTVRLTENGHGDLLMSNEGYIAAAVVLFFIGFFGFFLNLFVIVLMCKERQVIKLLFISSNRFIREYITDWLI